MKIYSDDRSRLELPGTLVDRLAETHHASFKQVNEQSFAERYDFYAPSEPLSGSTRWRNSLHFPGASLEGRVQR